MAATKPILFIGKTSQFESSACIRDTDYASKSNLSLVGKPVTEVIKSTDLTKVRSEPYSLTYQKC